MQLGFSSNIPLWVTSGGVYFDSLVAKPLSILYYDSSFQQSNDLQKVHFNTDFLKWKQGYLYTKYRSWLNYWHVNL